ncbi:MAG TPA: chromosomal replication initiator protein DnaA, partial [Planctomycetota bacterium]|nr:chromosomal replication initiator protein DnaA [Planctomycetota bacterium]
VLAERVPAQAAAARGGEFRGTGPRAAGAAAGTERAASAGAGLRADGATGGVGWAEAARDDAGARGSRAAQGEDARATSSAGGSSPAAGTATDPGREDDPSPDQDSGGARGAGFGTGVSAGAPRPAAGHSASHAFFTNNSDVVLNPKYMFENFVVGPSNRFAAAAARAVADAPSASYNPLFVHGRVGLGKTHLLQAICHQVLGSNREARVLYLSSETFVNQFIGAIESRDLDRFRARYRNVDMLLVDDIHLLANKDRTQEEFFHTFNALYNAGHQIVLSSDGPASGIPTLKERLISRFKWGMEVELAAPGYETRLAIVRRKARDRGVDVPEEVLILITESIDTNIRELEGAITKVLGYAQLIHRDITVDLARQVLGLSSEGPMRPVTGIERVVEVVCRHFGVRLADLQGRKRTQSIALPRQTAMYLARKLTTLSLEEIGGHFGGRDHSTVLYAVDRTGDRIAQDRAFAQLVIDMELRAQR